MLRGRFFSQQLPGANVRHQRASGALVRLLVKQKRVYTPCGCSLPGMRIRINGSDGFHVLCDRCDKPARADGERPIFVEWDHDGLQGYDPIVVCASCNQKDPKRGKKYDATLGDVLLGLLLNACEPLAPAGERIVIGNDAFPEGDIAAFVGQVSALADVINTAGLG